MMNLSKRRWSGVAVGVVAVAALLAGCGSGGGDSASPDTTAAVTSKGKPAGAKENAAVAPVCHDLYNGGQLACAENTVGPGGGVIFYDAHSPQPWGQFLEVAPQSWNGALSDCSSCGVAAPATERGTADFGHDNMGYRPCTKGSTWEAAPLSALATAGVLPGSAADLPTAIGTGRANTAAILAVTQCTNANPDNQDPSWTVFQKATSYRGGGLTDWFVPSADEMAALWRFGNRNAIGGFPDNKFPYATSSTRVGGGGATVFTMVRTDSTGSTWGLAPSSWAGSKKAAVRPIRAF